MNKNIKKEVLTKISKEEIKMKPKWWFETINLTKKWVMILSILSGAILIGVAIYVVGLISPFELLGYGRTGIEVLLENIAYQKLLWGLLAVTIGGIIYAKTGTNYKKGRLKLISIMTMATIVLVMLATVLGIVLEL